MELWWIKALRIAHTLVLAIATWMIIDKHRSAAIILLVSAIGIQLTIASFKDS